MPAAADGENGNQTADTGIAVICTVFSGYAVRTDKTKSTPAGAGQNTYFRQGKIRPLNESSELGKYLKTFRRS